MQSTLFNSEDPNNFSIPDDFSIDENSNRNFSIVVPTTKVENRKPGTYEDIYSSYKIKHNLYIMNACKMLKAITKKGGIIAMLLDGKNARTTNMLLKLGDKVGKVYIIEISPMTFDKVTEMFRKDARIEVLNEHIGDYVNNHNDPYINLAYFDVMCTFFSSEKTDGSDILIKKFLDQSKVDEMIFAATFCLRGPITMDYAKQKNKILSKLKVMFLLHGFSYKMLLKDSEVIYKGQRANNKGMMFVLFYLNRN